MKTYTSQEMIKTSISDQQSWRNIAPLGEKPAWIIQDHPIPETDPAIKRELEGIKTLFGYDVEEFMRKQYL